MRIKYQIVAMMGLVALGLAVSATDAMAQSVDFSKADDVGNSFVMIALGALLVFGAPGIVADLKAAFS